MKALADQTKDYEPYFDRWNCVLFYPSHDDPNRERILHGHSGDIGSVPCFQHKTCMCLVKVIEIKPPRVCPHCHIDTVTEI